MTKIICPLWSPNPEQNSENFNCKSHGVKRIEEVGDIQSARVVCNLRTIEPILISNISEEN